MTWGALLIALFFATLSHASTAKHIVLPSGEAGYSIRCDNENINACYEIAGTVCHLGYSVVSQSRDSGFKSEGVALAGTGTGYAASSATSTTEKGLVIQCAQSDVIEKERAQREEAESWRAQSKAREQAADYEAGRQGSRWFFGIIGGVIVLGLLAFIVIAHSQ